MDEDYYDNKFTDAGMTEIIIKEELSAKEWDVIYAEKSGEVITYKLVTLTPIQE
ncbi:hypothetical protein [Virgibacillus salexigens]|uniref:DUF5590 domain-containing protein n=1 Tax=Virgibacillus kapii TaxID=1638645 RepID=A0ABQ2DWS0_9BACI|nr:hypothetical protein [Virgibacillus kapii]GGJ76341.1 hypothetical protein GCM10007111_42410 [Virgibacillus kapii]